jgi:hypothetical protein
LAYKGGILSSRIVHLNGGKMSIYFIYAGAALMIIWGIAHIIPTGNVVKGFGAISPDNKRIITMEWIAGGLAQCFIGVLVLLVTIFGGLQSGVTVIVYWASAVMLVLLAILTTVTGSRTPIVPMKICPVVNVAAAVLLVAGMFVK